ncbi:hypothetical protein ONZ43_g2154 [Nemania bipapillata]|uniref:Uncharacterized protein n=1 Tax=Nemania bipapillata TaxID=110536 RepID=A0ACC2J1S3_9PEZI|nr:hypothetical protein ONZ43_g2154 [Nemania bipapillata]
MSSPAHLDQTGSSTPSVADLLDPLHSQIRELMKIAGTAGLSLGVYRRGEPAYYANFGYRDIHEKLPVTERTVFAGCSLTKLFTALSMALVVDDESNDINWDTRIKDVLPDFAPVDFNMREQMTITDVLSHRTGMSIGNFYLGSDNNMLIAHKDSIKFLNDQVPINPFRSKMQYNNLGFEIAGLVIDKVAGSWADIFRQKFFAPLGMKRSFAGRPPPETENVAKAYNTLESAHPGSLPGALSAITMIPELETAIVVMTNTLALNDCPDWVTQLIIEQLLDAPQRNDYIAAAKSSAAATRQWYPNTLRALSEEHKTRRAAKPLDAYTGTYWNKQKYLKVEVTLEDGRLYWAIQGLETEKFELTHFDGDTFSWLRPRDYLAERGRWPEDPPVFWKLKFSTYDGSEVISTLNWVHDPDVLSGEDFVREI